MTLRLAHKMRANSGRILNQPGWIAPMEKKRLSVQQIVVVSKQAEQGTAVVELGRAPSVHS
jgi:hypothetical protein